MKKCIIVGGSSGIGLSLTLKMIGKGYHVFVFDKNEMPVAIKNQYQNLTFKKINLSKDNLKIIYDVGDVDALIITAGFGRADYLENFSEIEIKQCLLVNSYAPILLLNHFYSLMKSKKSFYCAVMVSICGHICSPLFSIYGAAKSGLASFIKNCNAELYAQNFNNRILDVSPGKIDGTSFSGNKTDLFKLDNLSEEIINRMLNREVLYIPNYDDVYKKVIDKNFNNYLEFGKESFLYKVNNNRLSKHKTYKIGYLSGTFDLFHIGHLKLLKRAKEQCDYLIVGVHKSGAWKGKETFIPFEERMEIIKSCRYVDEAIESPLEDCDAWPIYHYDMLFVGSDYKGSERFEKYKKYFEDKNVLIVYFPYTKTTSSTILRNKLKKDKNK